MAPPTTAAIVSTGTTPTHPSGGMPNKPAVAVATANGETKSTITAAAAAATTISIPSTAKTSHSLPTKGSVILAGGPLKAGNPTATAINSPTILQINKDYDPEYLKMIQSLGELDDFSIWDNLDNVDDEEFRLSDLEDDDDDDDDDNDDDDDDDEEDDDDDEEEDVDKKEQSAVPTTIGTTAIVPSTIQATASTITPATNKPATPSLKSPSLAIGSPSLNLPGWDDDQEDGGAFYKDLEEELGSLLEEELEAAVRSLYTSKGASVSNTNEDPKKKKQKLTKKQQQQLQQRQQALPASAFVATTTATAGTGSLTPVTAATLAAEAKRKEREANASSNSNSNSNAPGTPLRESARQGNSATVTYQQSQQLRTLMKKHYQLLAQQAILSVRAAHSIKSGNQVSATGTTSASSSSPTFATTSAALVPSKATTTTMTTSIPPPKSWGGNDFLCGENETDLTEILDLAVGMLQDLDQNRKDAIRTSIQLAMSSGNGLLSDDAKTELNGKTVKIEANGDNSTNSSSNSIAKQEQQHPAARRSLLSQFSEGSESNVQASNSANSKAMVAQSTPSPSNQGGSGRLTRAAFRKLQAQPIVGSKRTAFDIPGLLKLDETFSTIDDSVNIAPQQQQPKSSPDKKEATNGKKVNILEAFSHAQACRDVLKDAGANVEEALLPGVLDVSENFSQLEEHLGDDFKPPCSIEQEQFLRKNRNLFTSGEDNLVLRGVNLYGEKQWILIGDRYLPDRSVNIISQRYSKLCVMLYKAHGIYVDAMGNLLEPPKHESVDDIDEAKVKAVGLKLVEPPAILNVHRWSMEEDLTILKAVPIMGHMWAELGARLIPHRDRGHLRKRYQVLERRVKATITRGKKEKARNENRRGTTKARTKTPVKVQKPVKTKATLCTSSSTTGMKASSAQSTTASKARSSPARKEKKLPSPPKAKTTASKTTSAKRKGKKASLEISTSNTTTKNADADKKTSTSPMMSLESGAALLATLKPKETEKQSKIQTTETSAAKSAPVPAVKDGKTAYPEAQQRGKDGNRTTNAHPAMPQADPRRPYYPYVYDNRYNGRYPYHHHPGYPYHHHPPPGENSKNRPAASSQNTHPIPPAYYHPPPNYTGDRKPISIASPKPNMARPKDLDTPNSKSFLENIPKMVGEDFSALGADGDTSRQAYEKLMDFVGGSDEGLSRMQKMMENKDESEAAKAIVTHLAKSPGRGGTEFSNLLNSDSNITGLSLLNEISKSNSKDESGVSILARVLGSSSNHADAVSMPSPSKKTFAPKILPSPTKTMKADSFFRNSAGDPETPKKGMSSSSMFGSPLGLSPGLRTLRASALLKDDGIGATTSIPTPFSPPPSHLLKTEGLATNLTFPYSLAPSLSRGFDEKTDEDNRFSFDQDSRVCEDSNQLGDLAVGAPLSNAEQPNGNSLSIPQEEFDAISGLGALSNSPFKTVKSLDQKDANDKSSNKPSTSFFRRVVGDSKEKSPQKKLF